MEPVADLSIERLEWDDWNREHIARHDGPPREVTEVCFGEPVFRAGSKNRVMAIGPTRTGRMLTAVIGPKPGEPGTYYPFTARPASRRERRRDREAKGDQT